jgi:periplasmic protein TonB
MSTAIHPGVSRQSTVLAAIVALHLGVFLLIASGLGPRMLATLEKEPPPVKILPRQEEPIVEAKPDATPLIEPYHVPVLEPVVPLPEFAPIEKAPMPVETRNPYPVGNAPSVPVADDDAPPRLKTHRLAALIDSCYPSASRRLAEEGRIVARVTIGADGKALRWHVARSSGYTRLDEAVGCVIERLEFVAGRQDGRAAVMEADLPVAFRLN